MSRANPNEDVRTPNPAVRFYQWAGSSGNYEWYDKVNKKKVEVPLPFTFLPIDRCITLKGYNDDTKTSYWSNEVKDIEKDVFTVQSVSGTGTTKVIRTEAVGLYKDIKSTLDALDISYVESLYVGIKNESGSLDLCNIQIKGAAVKSWFEFKKNVNIWEIAVTVKSSVDKKKGAVKYKEPVYTAITKISKEINDQAITLNNKLNEYLLPYFEKNKATPEQTTKPAQNEQNTANNAPANSKPVEVPFEEKVEDINFGEDMTDIPF